MKLRQKLSQGGVLAATLVVIASIFAPLAHAADPAGDGSFNVVVSPPSTGLVTKPGVPVSTDMKVQNQGIATEHIKVTVMTFGADGIDGTPQLKDVKPADDYPKWAHFSTTKFDAEPNIWKDIKLTIAPPKTAAFGYYYAVIFSRDEPNKPNRSKQSNLQAAVASLILLDVQAPGAVRQSKIAEFSTTRKSYEFLPAQFNVRMRNTGNVHIAPRGNIVISKGGKNIALLEVNLKKGYILPDSYRKFTADWADGAPVYQIKTENGKVVLDKHGGNSTSLVWDKFSMSKLRFGKYDAKLMMVYDDGKGDVSTEAKLSFWVIPWRIIIGIALIVLLILAGLWAVLLRPLMGRRKNRGFVQRR